MGMLLTCSNKGCYSQDYHKLNKDTNQVTCVSCGGNVDVTQYVKTSLKAQGQIIRKPKPSLEVKCSSCGSSDGPVLLKYGKGVFKVGCKACKEINVHLTKYFLAALKTKSDIETVDMQGVTEVTEVSDISKTTTGAVIVNKPISADSKPQNKKVAKPTKAPAIKATLVDDDELAGTDLDERPKISVTKKNKADATKKADKLRQALVDPETGDVAEALKSTIQVPKL